MFKKLLIFSYTALILTGCAQQEGTSRGLPWWGWLILILAIVLLVYLLFRGKPKQEPVIKSMATKKEPEPQEDLIISEKMEEAIKPEVMLQPELEPDIISKPDIPDNLTMIEGIGPKIQSVLHAAGVKTFAQLADMAPEAIKALLTDAGLRLGVTDTWPEQARLAAEGKMDELKEFQDRLTGGREE